MNKFKNNSNIIWKTCSNVPFFFWRMYKILIYQKSIDFLKNIDKSSDFIFYTDLFFHFKLIFVTVFRCIDYAFLFHVNRDFHWKDEWMINNLYIKGNPLNYILHYEHISCVFCFHSLLIYFKILVIFYMEKMLKWIQNFLFEKRQINYYKKITYINKTKFYIKK